MSDECPESGQKGHVEDGEDATDPMPGRPVGFPDLGPRGRLWTLPPCTGSRGDGAFVVQALACDPARGGQPKGWATSQASGVGMERS